MQDEVYADLLFLVNFSMDFLCLYLCARLLHRPLSLWRGMLASALGGIYAVTVLFLTINKFPAFLIDAAVCVALCAVAMAGRRERWRSLFKLSALYLLVSMVLGGVMTALFSQLNRIPGVLDRVENEGMSAWLFFGMALLSALLTALWGRCFRRTTGKVPITVIVEETGQRIELNGIVDSGNLLRDPLGGRAVIPVEIARLQGVAPSWLLRMAATDRVGDMAIDPNETTARRIRLIPARGATGERLMVGWCPEHIYIREQNSREEREVSALIAPTKLSERQDGVAALVPSELI